MLVFNYEEKLEVIIFENLLEKIRNLNKICLK